MTRLALSLTLTLLLAVLSGCSSSPWKRGGVVTLPPLSTPARPATGGEGGTPPVAASLPESARAVRLTLPLDWYWTRRGDDLVATRDGVFLQNLTVERFHVDSREQSEFMFPRIAFSARQWPLRTLRYLLTPLTAPQSPEALIDAVLASRAATPGVSELTVRERSTTTLAGWPAGRVEYDFRLAVQERQPLYRASSVIAMVGEWCYVVTGVAAARYYYDHDGEALATISGSLQLRETKGGGGRK